MGVDLMAEIRQDNGTFLLALKTQPIVRGKNLLRINNCRSWKYVAFEIARAGHFDWGVSAGLSTRFSLPHWASVPPLARPTGDMSVICRQNCGPDARRSGVKKAFCPTQRRAHTSPSNSNKLAAIEGRNNENCPKSPI